MNRFDCSGSSGGGLGLRAMRLPHSSMKGSRSCRGSLGKRRPRRFRSLGCPHLPLAFSPCATSRFIGQPATFGTLKCQRRTLYVIDPELFTVAIAKVEFRQVARQVRFADVLVYAIDATFQYREEAFNGIGMHVVA